MTESQGIAAVHIHVERAIQRYKEIQTDKEMRFRYPCTARSIKFGQLHVSYATYYPLNPEGLSESKQRLRLLRQGGILHWKTTIMINYMTAKLHIVQNQRIIHTASSTCTFL